MKSENINIPEDIAFVGFSNEPISAVIEPSLTTVNQGDFEIGKISTSILIEQINDNVNKENPTEILRPELIIRNSSKK